MKKLSLLLSLGMITTLATSAYADNWLEGTYMNQDKNNSMDEIIFCKDGKVSVAMTKRKYKILTKNNEQYVELNSNGKFTFKVSADKKELSPADKFTKDWFTQTGLKLDAKKKGTCNW
jgi:hypothetical protein